MNSGGRAPAAGISFLWRVNVRKSSVTLQSRVAGFGPWRVVGQGMPLVGILVVDVWCSDVGNGRRERCRVRASALKVCLVTPVVADVAGGTRVPESVDCGNRRASWERSEKAAAR